MRKFNSVATEGPNKSGTSKSLILPTAGVCRDAFSEEDPEGHAGALVFYSQMLIFLSECGSLRSLVLSILGPRLSHPRELVPIPGLHSFSQFAMQEMKYCSRLINFFCIIP